MSDESEMLDVALGSALDRLVEAPDREERLREALRDGQEAAARYAAALEAACNDAFADGRGAMAEYLRSERVRIRAAELIASKREALTDE